jgi:hypothetical protein
VLVPDVSQRNIEIAYSFTGAELLLFGAILYPGGRGPAAARPTDIVVVVKGPTQSILVREKEKVAGIWVNAQRTALSLGAQLLRDRLVPPDRPDRRRTHPRDLRTRARQPAIVARLQRGAGRRSGSRQGSST